MHTHTYKQVFRAEFLRAYQTPLSSNAYSDGTALCKDSEANNMDVARASQYLRKVLIISILIIIINY